MQSLTVPTTKNTVIRYSGFEEASLAVQKLVENNTNSKTISSTNAMLISTLQRSFGSVFIVGHGSEEGIQEGSQIHSWRNVSKLASFSSGSAVFFVAGNSNEAPKYVPNKFSYGFSGNIEAVSAALIASYLSGSSSVTLEAIITRIVQVFVNPSKFSFLPTIDSFLANSGGGGRSSSTTPSNTCSSDLSEVEIGYSVVNIFFALATTLFASLRLFGASKASVHAFITKYAPKFAKASFFQIFLNLGGIVTGQTNGDLRGAFGIILRFLRDFVRDFMETLGWWQEIAFIGLATEEYALGTTAKIVLIVTTLLTLGLAFGQLIYDATDCNDHPW